MGYTHYMYRKKELPKSKWTLFSEDAEKILAKADCPLSNMKRVGGEWKDIEGYIVDKKIVNFNGLGDDSHETMYIERVHTVQEWEKKGEETAFTFCKTAYKPYDKYVTAIALLASLHFGKDVKNSSDGEQSDWEAGKAVLEETLGIKTEWNTSVNPEDEHDISISVKLIRDKNEREETKKTPDYVK